jgi:hypothetical protein
MWHTAKIRIPLERVILVTGWVVLIILVCLGNTN